MSDLFCGLFQVGSTPLHRAASTGYCELCELLIEEGAKVDAADRTGQTPLMHAVICENKEVWHAPLVIRLMNLFCNIPIYSFLYCMCF